MTSALLLIDLQNDFLHPDGAYHRGGAVNPQASGLVERLVPVAGAARAAGVPVIASRFTLVPGRGGTPIIADHLRRLRPFLGAGDFSIGSWGHAVVDELQPVDGVIDKVVYSAFQHTRLEWLLRALDVDTVAVAGIVTNGGVASTVRDGHSRGFGIELIADGCAAFDAEAHAATVTSLGAVAEVIDTATAIGRFTKGQR